ncbi:MAG: MFS transporter [Planctomycetota bacterium]
MTIGNRVNGKPRLTDMSISSSNHSEETALQAAETGVPGQAGVADRFTLYLVFLFLCLSTVGFVDSFATSFRYSMITYVREDLGESFASIVGTFKWVYLGSCLSFVPRVLADVFGRRLLLWITMVGLSLLQWALGFARTPHEYVLLLVLLAIFYKSDIWLLVMSEEAPPAHRGLCAALTVAFSCSGILVLGSLVHRMGDAPGAWRDVARFPVWGLLASIPILLFVRETCHFKNTRPKLTPRLSWRLIRAPFQKEYRRRLIVMSVLKMFVAGGAVVMISLMGTEYLRVDNGFSQERIGRIIQLDVVAIIAAWAIAGALSDRIGRHRCLYAFGLVFVISLLNLALLPKGSIGVLIAYVAQACAATGVYAILRVVTLELFPNDFRATASAWTDLFMTLFAAVTAWFLSIITNSPDSGGPGVSLTTCIICVALVLPLVLPLFGLLRETRGSRLENIR